jgi:hypothetical protein
MTIIAAFKVLKLIRGMKNASTKENFVFDVNETL